MNVIPDWRWLQRAHEIVDRLVTRDRDEIVRAIEPHGIDRRRFLGYLGVGAVAVAMPRIFLPPARARFVIQKSPAWQGVDYFENSIVTASADQWAALGSAGAQFIRDRMGREGFARKVLGFKPLSLADLGGLSVVSTT